MLQRALSSFLSLLTEGDQPASQLTRWAHGDLFGGQKQSMFIGSESSFMILLTISNVI